MSFAPNRATKHKLTQNLYCCLHLHHLSTFHNDNLACNQTQNWAPICAWAHRNAILTLSTTDRTGTADYPRWQSTELASTLIEDCSTGPRRDQHAVLCANTATVLCIESVLLQRPPQAHFPQHAWEPSRFARIVSQHTAMQQSTAEMPVPAKTARACKHWGVTFPDHLLHLLSLLLRFFLIMKKSH